MAEKQKTIGQPVSVSGNGLHTGIPVTLTFKPAPENTGFIFRRTDIEGNPEIPADVDYVVDTSRGTSLMKNDAHVKTVEHVLAAVMGADLDNLYIEMTQEETPIMDGSSFHFSEALKKGGIQEQNTDREVFNILSNIHYTDPEKRVEMWAMPNDNFRLSVMVDYETDVLGTQHAMMDSLDEFEKHFSPCRTFVFLHELEYLVGNNLIKGGDLNNAIVFVNRAVSQEELDKLAGIFNKPKVTVLKEGILNNLNLHFANEPARHKLLDIVGDLALVGKRINAHIMGHRPGHKGNVEFARMIKKAIQKEEDQREIPKYDPDAKPLYDIDQIKNILPHRPPFLLIDKILHMDETIVIGVKNVTMNESFFVGHFPDEPVMPAVLQIESMAQAGGILALNSVPDPENYLTYFVKIENAKFRRKVVPGDTLIFKLELTAPIRRGICQMKGHAFVGSKVVMEAELMAQLAKKPVE